MAETLLILLTSKFINTVITMQVNLTYFLHDKIRKRTQKLLKENMEEMGYCKWDSASELDRAYHDTEWGIPLHDDRKQFEYLSMEVMQCGLSWELMLRKREVFRECFDDFDYDKIARYSNDDLERIMKTEHMIRSERKIRAVINNAVCFQKIREKYGSFSEFLWAYSAHKTIIYTRYDKGEIPASNGLSEKISKDLKKWGFKYLGAITIYSLNFQ